MPRADRLMHEPLLGPVQVRRLASELGLHPRKALGQNFVVDPNTIRRIVRLADLSPGSQVLEIGPGLGSLTLGLLAAGHRVLAVEIDRVLADRLPLTVADRLPDAAGRLTVVCADAATFGPDLGRWATPISGPDLSTPPAPAAAVPDGIRPEAVRPDAVVANLPYNVAVPVLLHALAAFPSVRRSLVMVQQEVADRLAAPPGSRTYGVPSVKAAWFGDVRRVGSVPPAVFWPVPRVDSGLVAITAREVGTGPVADPWDRAARGRVFTVVDRTFAMRRKTLRASLTAWLGADRAATMLSAAGVAGAARPEQLDCTQFVRLGEALVQVPDADERGPSQRRAR